MRSKRRPNLLATLLNTDDPVFDQFKQSFGLIKPDLVTIFADNTFLLRKSFDDSKTPIDDLISLTTDGISNVANGVIPYYQNNGVGRKAYISSESKNGSKSIRFDLDSSDPTSPALQVWNSGFGVGVGGGSTYNCVEGSEIWARVYIKLSANWSHQPVDINTGYSTLKLFRVYPFNTYEGELIAQIDSGNGYTGYAGRLMCFAQNFSGGNLVLYGGTGGDCSGNAGAAADTPLNQWFAVELYAKISADPATAKVIMWRDGIKILERLGNTSQYPNRQTLNRTGSTIQIGSAGIRIYSTWDIDGSQTGPTLPNGAQSIWYDDIVLTNSRDWILANGEQDASGNWMIGTKI